MQDNQDGRDRAPLGFAFEGRDTLTSTGKMRCESQRGAIIESHAKETTEVQPHIEPTGVSVLPGSPLSLTKPVNRKTSSKIIELDNQIRNHI